MLHTATGLEAFIEVSDDNGVTWTRLPEYKPDIQAKECTAYVEAKTGQRFRMCLLDAQLQQRQEQFGVIYYFDGQKAASRAKRPDVVLKAIHGLEVDRQRQLPFIFGSVSGCVVQAISPGLVVEVTLFRTVASNNQ